MKQITRKRNEKEGKEEQGRTQNRAIQKGTESANRGDRAQSIEGKLREEGKMETKNHSHFIRAAL